MSTLINGLIKWREEKIERAGAGLSISGKEERGRDGRANGWRLGG